jgi:hypothetical protein
MEVKRYEYVGTMINDLGMELGAWIKQQKTRQPPSCAPVKLRATTMKRHGYLWDSIIDFANLLAAARQAQKGRRMRNNILRFKLLCIMGNKNEVVG